MWYTFRVAYSCHCRTYYFHVSWHINCHSILVAYVPTRWEVSWFAKTRRSYDSCKVDERRLSDLSDTVTRELGTRCSRALPYSYYRWQLTWDEIRSFDDPVSRYHILSPFLWDHTELRGSPHVVVTLKSPRVESKSRLENLSDSRDTDLSTRLIYRVHQENIVRIPYRQEYFKYK